MCAQKLHCLVASVLLSSLKLTMYVQVIAKAYDNPIPGFQTSTVGNLRLWEALPLHEFDLAAFNKGDYVQARAHPSTCSTLTADGVSGAVPAGAAAAAQF